jgi:hypothetical protein
MKIVNVEEMRRIEQAADAGGQSYAAMMEMAGGAVATISHTLMVPEADPAHPSADWTGQQRWRWAGCRSRADATRPSGRHLCLEARHEGR